MRALKKLFNRLIAPYQVINRKKTEIRPRMPAMTLNPLSLMLMNYEAKGKPVTVIQVGACDGIQCDPINDYLKKGFMRAVLLEPNPYAFVQLEKNYTGVKNVTLVQAAVAEEDGEADFYRIKAGTEGRQKGTDILYSSFSRDLLALHTANSEGIERIKVPCRSLVSLVTEFGFDHIDLLQVDAEGFDATIVRMALKLSSLPSCIHFEHTHIRSKDRVLFLGELQERDYLLSYDDLDILAVQRRLLEQWRGTGA
jgi:FkbM family methyltransferase